MPYAPSKKRRVLVGTPSSDYPSRCNEFFECIEKLIIPPGSIKRRPIGDAFSNIDLITELALQGNFTHIFFIDDDQEFPPNILMKLLDHNVPVVTGCYLNRRWPFNPTYFEQENEKGQMLAAPIQGKPGLRPIISSGMGCFLIETQVYKDLKKPYYRLMVRDNIRFGCDIMFCEDLRAIGVPIYVDTNQVVRHASTCKIQPVWNEKEEKWETKLLFIGGEVNVEVKL